MYYTSKVFLIKDFTVDKKIFLYDDKHVDKNKRRKQMNEYYKQMLFEYLVDTQESQAYHKAVGLVTDFDILEMAVDSFIVDLFINEEDDDSLSKYIEYTSEKRFLTLDEG